MKHAGFAKGLGQSMEQTKEEIKSWEGKLSQLCMIEIDAKPIGELSYRINDDGTAYSGWKICDFDYQNKGYGPKIIKLLFEFIFTDVNINSKFYIDKIMWDTMLENKRAQYVYENKIKARKIGITENSWKDQQGDWRCSVEYAISRDEFLNNK